MTPVAIPTRQPVLGRSIDRVGRVGRHPDAPRRRDCSMPETGANRPALITRAPDADLRNRWWHGKVVAKLDDKQPAWVAGDVVAVARDLTRREPPLKLEVTSVRHLELREVDAVLARRLGFLSLADFARSRYGRAGNGMMLERRLKADEQVVWLTEWQPNTDDKPRWLVKGGGHEGGSGYAESPTVGMTDAGACVPEAYQRILSGEQAPEIKAGARKGSKAKAAARVPNLRAEAERRRPQRPATLPR